MWLWWRRAHQDRSALAYLVDNRAGPISRRYIDLFESADRLFRRGQGCADGSADMASLGSLETSTAFCWSDMRPISSNSPDPVPGQFATGRSIVSPVRDRKGIIGGSAEELFVVAERAEPAAGRGLRLMVSSEADVDQLKGQDG